MKTLIIWDDCQANIRFRIVDGYHFHLDGKYVNAGSDQETDDQIMALTLDPETGRTLPMTETWPGEEFAAAVNSGGCVVIVCGFIP